MGVVKRFFVRSQGHLAGQRHSRDEVTADIENVKAKHLAALPTVKDLFSIYSIIDLANDK